MARYKLTIVSWYEDNEQAGGDEYNQQYVQSAAEGTLDYWERAEAELQVDGRRVFSAGAEGGPRKPEDYRRTRWPWVLASEMLPPEDCRCVIYVAGDWEEAEFRKARISPVADSVSVRTADCFITADRVEMADAFGHLWWRTIDAPDMEDDTKQ